MHKRGWEGGVATIVARQDSKGLAATLRDSEMGRSWVYDYVADVEPDNGAPTFRASFTVHFGSSTVRGSQRRPAEGEQARVIFHPSSKKVEFDRAALRSDVRDEAQASDDSFQEIASAGVPSSQMGAPSDPAQQSAGGARDVTHESKLDPESMLSAVGDTSAAVGRLSATTSDLSGTIAAIKAARASGDLAEVDRLKAFAARSGDRATAAREAAAGVGSRDALSAPLDRLQQLADLRDRGALTDEEFAAEKAKILGES